MTLDIAWIDSQIARLQRLREIATDPEMMKLMKLAEANGSSAAATIQSTIDKVKTQAAIAIHKPQRGTLTKAVKDAALKETNWFTGYELTDKMQAQGFGFAAANPNISVIDVLRKMAAKD